MCWRSTQPEVCTPKPAASLLTSVPIPTPNLSTLWEPRNYDFCANRTLSAVSWATPSGKDWTDKLRLIDLPVNPPNVRVYLLSFRISASFGVNSLILESRTSTHSLFGNASWRSATGTLPPNCCALHSQSKPITFRGLGSLVARYSSQVCASSITDIWYSLTCSRLWCSFLCPW